MKLPYFILISISTILISSLTQAQQPAASKGAITTDTTLVVPPAVSTSAQRAVQLLGDKTKAEDYLYAYNLTYDRYKTRKETRLGVEGFKKEYLSLKDKMLKLGASVESYKAEKPTGFFLARPVIKSEIKAKIKSGALAGPRAGDQVYHWISIVPTTQVWKFLSKNGKPPRFLERKQYQIAVALQATTPGQEQWTFFTPLNEQELRTLFPSLSARIKLPTSSDKEIKK